ncbi:MAG: protein phosphatase 2C domain-containing protein [Actinomycetota bacterium]|nr:protein phosphatase 2C domain-containing protein [Actinomycetota bacterium]
MTDAATDIVRCPACAEAVVPGDAFCESCGAAVSAGAVAPTDDDTMPMELPPNGGRADGTTFSPAPGVADECLECGGDVLDDGFCSQCGKRAPSPRDHFRESPVDWVGGVCDRGIAHARNEDAMALAGMPDRSLAVLVVCDGVTSAPDSDRASLAAAREACAALVSTPLPTSQGVAATLSHWSSAISRAAATANAATIGVARSLGNPAEPPSCTFVAAVLHRDVVTVGWCGDSRAYWLPDGGPAVALTLDHSLGTELMQRGMSQAEAEADSTFHTITRWLGADSVDPTAETSSRELDAPGWLLVCSDGLWNYASPPAAVRAVVDDQLAAGHTTPVALAAALVRWANEQGGHDNITAALARHEPSLR